MPSYHQSPTTCRMLNCSLYGSLPFSLSLLRKVDYRPRHPHFQSFFYQKTSNPPHRLNTFVAKLYAPVQPNLPLSFRTNHNPVALGQIGSNLASLTKAEKRRRIHCRPLPLLRFRRRHCRLRRCRRRLWPCRFGAEGGVFGGGAGGGFGGLDLFVGKRGLRMRGRGGCGGGERR